MDDGNMLMRKGKGKIGILQGFLKMPCLAHPYPHHKYTQIDVKLTVARILS